MKRQIRICSESRLREPAHWAWGAFNGSGYKKQRPGHGSRVLLAATSRSMTIWMPPVDAVAVARTRARHIYREPWGVFLRDLRERSLTGGEAGPLGGDGGVVCDQREFTGR